MEQRLARRINTSRPQSMYIMADLHRSDEDGSVMYMYMYDDTFILVCMVDRSV